MTPVLTKVRPRKQLTSFSCGPASLRTLWYYYGVSVSEKELIEEGEIEEDGTDFKTMRRLAHQYGFSFYSKNNGTLEEVKKWLNKKTPVLVCYQDHGPNNGHSGHYAVISGIDNSWIYIADSSNYYEGDGQKFAQTKKMTIENFSQRWWEIDGSQKYKRWYSIIKPYRKK